MIYMDCFGCFSPTELQIEDVTPLNQVCEKLHELLHELQRAPVEYHLYHSQGRGGKRIHWLDRRLNIAADFHLQHKILVTSISHFYQSMIQW